MVAADGTFIEAPSSTKNKAHARDPEMASGKKANTWHFGMKEHIAGECQDFCVWGGYSRGSPTRLPFVFEMQYARPDAIAGAKVEGPARSARGLIISLPYSMAPVKRSPNSRANWGMAAAHLGVARFQEAVKFMMAR